MMSLAARCIQILLHGPAYAVRAATHRDAALTPRVS